MAKLLRRYWWLILLVAMVAGVTAYVGLKDRPPAYEARARVLVGDLSTNFDLIRASESLAETYAELASTDTVLDRAVDLADLDVEAAALGRTTSVVTVGTTRVMLITATDEDPSRAVDYANAVADALGTLEESFNTEGPAGIVTVLDRASDPEQVSADLALLVFVAMAGGAVFVVGAVVVLEPSPDLGPARG